MKAHYGDKIELMYTDTGHFFFPIINSFHILTANIILDSLVYFIQTINFYKDLENYSDLLDRKDTSDLPIDHPCYIAERKKIPELFSDETKGVVMTELCALRAKSCALKINGQEKIKSKGIRGHVIKNHMNFKDHWRRLLGDTSLNVKTDNVPIRSFSHQLKTIKSNKLTYNSFDDKRIILEDKVHTLAHGHFRIEWVIIKISSIIILIILVL